MDESIITNPGDIILIKIGKEKQLGFYAKVIDVVADKFKRNFWVVRFHPFVPTEDFKIITMSWKLDDDQIRGQEFTMNDVPHQLFKVKFPEDEVIEPEKMFEKPSQEDKPEQVVDHIDKDAEHPNELSNLKLVDNPRQYVDDQVPLPKLKNTGNKKPFLTLVK